MSTPDLIGTVEAAEIIGVERSTLSRWVASGRITPAMQLQGTTGAMLFHRADAVALASALADGEAAEATAS